MATQTAASEAIATSKTEPAASEATDTSKTEPAASEAIATSKTELVSASRSVREHDGKKYRNVTAWLPAGVLTVAEAEKLSINHLGTMLAAAASINDDSIRTTVSIRVSKQ